MRLESRAGVNHGNAATLGYSPHDCAVVRIETNRALPVAVIGWARDSERRLRLLRLTHARERLGQVPAGDGSEGGRLRHRSLQRRDGLFVPPLPDKPYALAQIGGFGRAIGQQEEDKPDAVGGSRFRDGLQVLPVLLRRDAQIRVCQINGGGGSRLPASRLTARSTHRAACE